ncbi:hypothetical protein WN51_01826 [Melipona quadrifasciata]|uniref:Uncharacterized protein n=1 Tax=Melipona quadrifasciata TaxID=166423 RepID=A0A0M8ZZ73_9HYME|nr:hypothetical protein WN51_01826 [Melipona quadrifasciata]
MSCILKLLTFFLRSANDRNFPLCQPDKILITETDNSDLLVFSNKMLYFRIDTRKHKYVQRPSNDLRLLNGSSEKQVVQASKTLFSRNRRAQKDEDMGQIFKMFLIRIRMIDDVIYDDVAKSWPGSPEHGHSLTKDINPWISNLNVPVLQSYTKVASRGRSFMSSEVIGKAQSTQSDHSVARSQRKITVHRFPKASPSFEETDSKTDGKRTSARNTIPKKLHDLYLSTIRHTERPGSAIAQYQTTPLLLEVYPTPLYESRDPNQPIANFRCISVAPEDVRFSGLPQLKSLSVIKEKERKIHETKVEIGNVLGSEHTIHYRCSGTMRYVWVKDVPETNLAVCYFISIKKKLCDTCKIRQKYRFDQYLRRMKNEEKRYLKMYKCEREARTAGFKSRNKNNRLARKSPLTSNLPRGKRTATTTGETSIFPERFYFKIRNLLRAERNEEKKTERKKTARLVPQIWRRKGKEKENFHVKEILHEIKLDKGIKVTVSTLNSKLKQFWKEGIMRLPKRWKKVMEQNGSYIT